MQLAVESTDVISRAEAKARGLTRYFTDRPCKHGHVAVRFTVNGSCSECASGIQKRHRKKHATRIVAREKAYRATKADHLREVKRRWATANQAKRQRQNAEWYQRNPSKAAERRKAWAEAGKEWRASDPERSRQKRRDAYARNPEPHRRRAVTAGGKRRAVKRNASVADQAAIARFVKRMRESRRVRCYWCRKPVPQVARHLDHIIPLARGGAHTAANLCTACSTCNLRKHAKLPYEFAGQGELEMAGR